MRLEVVVPSARSNDLVTSTEPAIPSPIRTTRTLLLATLLCCAACSSAPPDDGPRDTGHVEPPDASTVVDGGGDSSPDAGSSDAGDDVPDAGDDVPDAGEPPTVPAWPPAFISALGLSYDGPVADGAEVWVELTIADPAGLAALGGWSLTAADHVFVNVQLTSAQLPFPLVAGDVVRVHGALFEGVTDARRSDNNPALWDVVSTEPFGPNFKHGLLWLEASDGRVLDAVLYETGRNQGDWLDDEALAAAEKVVAQGEWPSTADADALFIEDNDRHWARLGRGHEGDAATDWQVVGADPASYYERAAGRTGPALEAALHEIIADHVVIPYSDVAPIFTQTDPDPARPGFVIDFYTGRSTERDFNKEHVWAKSHGGFSTDTYAGFSDLHHLRPTRPDINTRRWHLDFDEGGELYSDSGCRWVPDLSFEPRDAVKGDVARTLFYMAVRYEGDDAPMPDLELVEDIPSLRNARGEPDNDEHVSTPRHGRLSTLLRWHVEDPPDDRERARNEVIFERYQRNRNPFVDHPEWVHEIWAGPEWPHPVP